MDWILFGKIFWLVFLLVLFGMGIYIEFFLCGSLTGTMADIPRYCWWFR